MARGNNYGSRTWSAGFGPAGPLTARATYGVTEHSCKLTSQIHVTKTSELALVVCKQLRDFTEILYIVD